MRRLDLSHKHAQPFYSRLRCTCELKDVHFALSLVDPFPSFRGMLLREPEVAVHACLDCYIGSCATGVPQMSKDLIAAIDTALYKAHWDCVAALPPYWGGQAQTHGGLLDRLLQLHVKPVGIVRLPYHLIGVARLRLTGGLLDRLLA